MDRISVMI